MANIFSLLSSISWVTSSSFSLKVPIFRIPIRSRYFVSMFRFPGICSVLLWVCKCPVAARWAYSTISDTLQHRAYTFSVGTVSLPRDDSFIDYDTFVCFCYQPAIICDNDIWWPLRNVFMPAINHATTFHTHASLHYISLGVYQWWYREYQLHVFSIKSPLFFDHISEVQQMLRSN